MKNKLLSLGMIIIIIMSLFSLAGCGKKLTREEIDEGAIKELERIYNDDLTLVSRGQGYGGDVFGRGSNVELILKSQKFSNEKIQMRYSYDSKNKKYELLGSNYNFIRYKNNILERLEILSEIYPDYKIHLKSYFDTDKDYTFDEYISSKKYLDIFIFLAPSVDSSSKDSDIEKIRMKLEQSRILVTGINVYYVKNQELYNSINPQKISSDEWGTLNSDCLNGTFYMNTNYEWDNQNWENEQ